VAYFFEPPCNDVYIGIRCVHPKIVGAALSSLLQAYVSSAFSGSSVVWAQLYGGLLNGQSSPTTKKTSPADRRNVEMTIRLAKYSARLSYIHRRLVQLTAICRIQAAVEWCTPTLVFRHRSHRCPGKKGRSLQRVEYNRTCWPRSTHVRRSC